jgi:hypothetical protein
MTGARVNMNRNETAPLPPTERSALPSPRRYDPPRLTEKRALAEVTLFSTPQCQPGTPGCQIGHP